jgi:hypothetical protein
VEVKKEEEKEGYFIWLSADNYKSYNVVLGLLQR